MNWDELPDDVANLATEVVLDNLACLIAGSTSRSYQIARDYVVANWQGHCSLVDFEWMTGMEGAAFANAVACNAYDLDDYSPHGWGHPGAMVFPTALAIAEHTGASGKDFLTAIVFGYEIAARAGDSMHSMQPMNGDRSYRSCGSWGAVAAAATAAFLMGTDVEQAMNIAAYHSPFAPMMRDLAYPTMVKHAHGPAAMIGVQAARLAALGFTGPPSDIDLSTLGTQWAIKDVRFKDYACCYWAHPAIEAVAALKEQEPFTGREVTSIHVETHSDALLLGAKLPTTSEEAQFNIAWPVAAMIQDDDVGWQQVSDRALKRPDLIALASKVTLSSDPTIDKLYWLSEMGDPDGREMARVIVHLDNGHKLDSRLVSLSRRFDTFGKFLWTIGGLINRPDMLNGLIYMLPELDSIHPLTAWIRGMQGPRRRM